MSENSQTRPASPRETCIVSERRRAADICRSLGLLNYNGKNCVNEVAEEAIAQHCPPPTPAKASNQAPAPAKQ